MSAVTEKLNSAQKHLEAFEAWKVDHDAAMECYDLEEWLVEGLFTFEVVVRTDSAVRRSIYRGLLESSLKLTDCCRELYKLWLHTAKSNLPAFEKYEAMFGVVKHADEFRERIERAEHVVKNWTGMTQAQAPSMYLWEVSEEEVAKLHALVKAMPGSPGTLSRKPQPMTEGDASLIR